MDAMSGNVLRTIRSESQGAAISPDGRYIAYADSSGLALKLLVVASGDTRTLVALKPPSRVGNMATIAWTPDGKAVVYGQMNDGEGHVVRPGRWPRPPPHRRQRGATHYRLALQYQDESGRVHDRRYRSERLEVWKMENFLP